MEPGDYRKLLFSAYYDNDTKITIHQTEGFFHRWADDYLILDDERYKIVVGIVEAKDGMVYKVPPEAIAFDPLLTENEKNLKNFKAKQIKFD
jgi:hypothetical protein